MDMHEETTSQTAAAAAAAATPRCCHRGDPLDVPLIDDHLASRLLLPRLTSALRLAFPDVHLDWTTGVPAAERDDRLGGEAPRRALLDPLAWKRIADATVRLCLMLGSCQLVRERDGGLADVRLRTPAMRSLGMFLRPISGGTRKGKPSVQPRVYVYGKVVALALATIVVPSLYEELRRRRERQLEERERRLRLDDIRRELRPSSVATGAERERISGEVGSGETISLEQRARERRSLLRSFLAEVVLGIGDVLLPPLKLMAHLAYLWGMTSAPSLAMRMAGWEYYSSADPLIAGDIVSNSGVLGDEAPYQRHANFQYGNRRLLVEEALRTLSAVLPQRDTSIGMNGGGNDNRSQGRALEENQRATVAGRRGMLGWFPSLASAAEDEGNDGGQEVRPPSTVCSACHAQDPVIPYVTSCGHVYCYLCLRAAVTDDPGFRCVVCGAPVASSGRPRPPSRAGGPSRR